MKKISGWIYCKFEKWLIREERTKEYAIKMYGRDNWKDELRCIWCDRIRIMLLGMMLLVLSPIVCIAATNNGNMLSDHELDRSREEWKGTIHVDNGKTKLSQKLVIPIGRRKLTLNEKRMVKKQVSEYLQKHILGNNKSFQEISSNLVFAKQIPIEGVTLEYWPESEKYISSSGELGFNHIPAGGVDTRVEVMMSCGEYEDTLQYEFHIIPPQVNQTALRVSRIKKEILDAVSKQAEKEHIVLPVQFGEEKIAYIEEKEKVDFRFVVLVLVILILLPILWNEKRKRALRTRERQLLLDYPAFTNRVMLLLGAGVSVGGVLMRMSEEYMEERKKGAKRQLLYEEVVQTSKDIRQGINEAKAIEHFGEQIGLLPYLRFSNVITQNIKKGAHGIMEMLETDIRESLQQRKEMVKRTGEEASTKLLLPMMLMLIEVMAIIMIPAFMSM